jgi:glucokinase
MATAAILLNGIPSAAKSTLGVTLATLLGCPVLATEAVSASLAELTGPTVAPTAVYGIAMDAVWSLAAEIKHGVVIDAAWFGDTDAEFARAGIQRSGAPRVVELWCDGDAGQPTGMWPVVRVDAASAINMDALLPELAARLLG